MRKFETSAGKLSLGFQAQALHREWRELGLGHGCGLG